MTQPPKENHSQKEQSANGQSTEHVNSDQASNIIGKAHHIVSKAVDVLEEEIAAGILAAKELEKKVIDVDEIRDTNPNELMFRLRKDAHDVVDLLLDAITTVTKKLGSLSNNLVNIPETATLSKTNGQVPVLKGEEAIAAGTELILPILLGNDDPKQNRTIRLNKVDMIGPGGNRIKAKQIQLIPESIELLPSEKKEMTIKIKAPKNTPSGIYTALFQDVNLPMVRAIIELEIK